MKILLLEDDIMLQEIISEHLEALGHRVEPYADGLEAEDAALEQHFDLWLFDINVPSQSGIELLKGLRAVNSATPALFITAQTASDTVREAFDSGADDYLKKPFDLVELDARIGYIQKKFGLDQELMYLSPATLFNISERFIEIDGEKQHLSHKETLLLQFLATRKFQLHTHDALSEVVWEHEAVPTDNTLRTYIKKIRRILGKDAIVTVHGLGYRFEY